MYLLDTDTVIYAMKGDSNVLKRFAEKAAQPKSLSVITYGELVFGAEKSAHRLENLARVWRLREIYPVIDVSQPIMECFASLKADVERAGKRVDDFDLVIAATALVLGFRLVTNNERHFRHIPGLGLENWKADL